jgi:hypothetical protein
MNVRLPWIGSAVLLASTSLPVGCTDHAGQLGVPGPVGVEPVIASENTSAAVTLEWVDVYAGESGYHQAARLRLRNGSDKPITLRGFSERFPHLRLTWLKNGEWTDHDLLAKLDPAHHTFEQEQLVNFTLPPGSQVEFEMYLLGPTNLPMKAGTDYWLASSGDVPDPAAWPTVWTEAKVPDDL